MAYNGKMSATQPVIDAILSQDTKAASKAAWVIIRTNDPSALNEYAQHIDAFAQARTKLRLVTGLRDRRDDVDFAIKVLKAHVAGNCRCALYPTTQLLSPRSEQESGFVIIAETQLDRDLYQEQFYVICLNCGKHQLCKEIQGYHFPLFDWE